MIFQDIDNLVLSIQKTHARRESTNVQMHEETFDDSIKDKKAKKNPGREAPSVQMHGETYDHSIKDKKAKKISRREVKSFEMHGETFDHSIKDKKANKKSKTIDHRQRSKDLSCESGSNSDSERQTNIISKGEHSRNDHSDTHINGTKSIPSLARRTSSSSSSESSSDNFFRIKEAFKYTKSGKDYVSSSESSDKSKVDNNLLVPTSTYQVYDLSRNQKGFSRELTKSGEEISTVIKSVDVKNLQTIETSYGPLMLEGERLSEVDNEIKTSHQTKSYEPSKSNVSILSHSSDIGMSSIAFPKKKRTRKWAYFYNCRWVFCHLWSSCECSNCCWGSSCCWNCNRAKYRHRTSPILTEVERNNSMKMDIPRQQSDKQDSKVTNDSIASYCSCFQSKQESEVTSNSSYNFYNWFNCFSCPSCCTWDLSCTSCKCCC
ncbi:hypothetical protein GLYMA_02G117300v4 [Glycine max]|nr:hypothetical protein GLYMA_02G117300v4 [Glycine max]KAH1059925.1 hypothetical protein GYH30_003754 [Glycine max]